MSNPPLLPKTFNRLAWSNLAAQSAEQIALAAAPIVAVLLLGVGEGQTGLLQTALTLPFILFAIPAGLLADRISRRWLMAGAEALRASQPVVQYHRGFDDHRIAQGEAADCDGLALRGFDLCDGLARHGAGFEQGIRCDAVETAGILDRKSVV